jgi:hypothetical protein
VHAEMTQAASPRDEGGGQGRPLAASQDGSPGLCRRANLFDGLAPAGLLASRRGPIADSAGLLRLGNTAHEFDLQKSVLECGTLDLNVILKADTKPAMQPASDESQRPDIPHRLRHAAEAGGCRRLQAAPSSSQRNRARRCRATSPRPRLSSSPSPRRSLGCHRA